MPADERQEFRLPALLKEHMTRAAAQSGQTLAEYITTALADRVTVDLAASNEWALSVDEQAVLMKILAGADSKPSVRAQKTAERADAVFGPLDSPKKR